MLNKLEFNESNLQIIRRLVILNETINVLLNHKSVRKYQDKKIESEILEKLLDAGIRAPSSGNLQNYSLLVIDEKEKLEFLAEETYSPFVKEAPLVIIACIDQYRFYRLCNIYDAPFHFDNADAVFIGVWDAIVAMHNIVIAAESLGLGTCYIGLILSTKYKEILNIPDYVYAVGMVSIGYPHHETKLRSRHPKEAIVHRNTYQNFSDEKLMSLYDNWLKNWPRFYDKLSDEKKKHWNEELGVYNNVQYITKTVYTREIIEELGKKAIENLRKAKFEMK